MRKDLQSDNQPRLRWNLFKRWECDTKQQYNPHCLYCELLERAFNWRIVEMKRIIQHMRARTPTNTQTLVVRVCVCVCGNESESAYIIAAITMNNKNRFPTIWLKFASRFDAIIHNIYFKNDTQYWGLSLSLTHTYSYTECSLFFVCIFSS